MNKAEHQLARQYLLGMVSEAVAEQIELRLLTDSEYANDFNILVDQITDEYVRGEFQGEELKQVEQVFFRSTRRREELALALALKRVQAEQMPATTRDLQLVPKIHKHSHFKIYLPIAATVLIALGLGVWGWKVIRDRSEINDAVMALNSVYNEQRPIESRISALGYAPFLTTRGPDDDATHKVELQRAELTLLNALRNRPSSPSVHHALGQVYLAKKQFDDAIEQFSKALESDSSNAVLHSDLGAAWLEKGKVSRSGSDQGKSLEAFLRSLEQLDRALELNPNLLEALFNRAIVHQYLMLSDPAEADWQQYLNKDSSSGWANEARANLSELQRKKSKSQERSNDIKIDFLAAFESHDPVRGWELIRQNRDSAAHGKLIRDLLLDEYLQSANAREKDHARKILSALAFLGQIESTQTQDVYTSELASFYANTTTSRRNVLIDARQLLRVAQGHHGQSKPREALPLFEKARQMFTSVGNVWEANLAELWVGYCHLNATNKVQSISILTRLASYFERQRFTWLHMRSLHLLSGAEYNSGEYSRAIEHNRRSLSIAQQIDDSRGAFNTLSILIEQYRYIGNYQQAFDCIQRSLSLLEVCDLSTEQSGQYFSIVAAALSSAGLFRAAADYQRAAIQMMLPTGKAQTISRAYANLGAIYGRLGRYDEAVQQATRGYETAKSLSDERIRKEMMAYVSQRIGDLYREAGNVPQAIQSYDECLSLHKSLDNYYGLYEAHRSLFMSHLSTGDDESARKELETTLFLIERYRSQILEQNNRNQFFANEQSVYDLAIDYEFSRKNDPEKAFNYSESSRSRSLLDLAKSNGRIAADTSDSSRIDVVFHSKSEPLTLRDIQSQMPEQAQIVQYAVLKDKLLIWLISKGTVSTFNSPVAEEELTEKVSQYVNLVLSGAEVESMQAAKDLYHSLITPIEGQLDSNRIIYFIPDKALNSLPFGALISPNSGRFLVQEHSFAISPSATFFITSSNLARTRAGAISEKILSIGNPRFSVSEYPTLEDLPAAKKEAKEVARFYDSHLVLTGEEATKLAVQREMQKAGIIHFAGHGILNQHSSLQSKLILAEQRGADSQQINNNDLQASDIYKMNLGHARLVVLSSCESGLGKYYEAKE